MKICVQCKKSKSLTEFYKNKGVKSGLQAACKQCQIKRVKARYWYDPAYHRDYDLRRCFGITLADYNRMFEAQHGKCAICDKLQSEQDRAFAVDHDHNTGKVRGLLCNSCNKGLGLLQDDPSIVLRAASYLITVRK